VISSSQRPLPHNTRQPQQTNFHASGGIRTLDLSRRAVCSRSPAEIVGYSQYVSVEIYLNENTWLRWSLMNPDLIVWYLRHTTCPLLPNIYWYSGKNCVITSGKSVCECYSVCRHLYRCEFVIWQANIEFVNELINYILSEYCNSWEWDKNTLPQMTQCFRSLPHMVSIHCHNLDRMPLDKFYMVCFSTNIRNIFNNCSEIIIGIWNINSYIYTRKLWSSVFMPVIITSLRTLDRWKYENILWFVLYHAVANTS